MYLRLIGISCLVAGLVNVHADGDDGSFYLKPKSFLYSPDKKHVCWTESLEQNGVRLMVRENVTGAVGHSLWTSIRTIGAQWSPNSRWLAVEDNYLAAESAILIFDINQSNHPLVYQSPVSKTEQDVWTIAKWDTEKKLVELRRQRRFGKGLHFITVILQDKSIEPLLYTD